MVVNETYYHTTAVFNYTLYNNTALCNLRTCPLDWAQLDYVPSLSGNALYAAIFAICLALQIILGIIYRTWPFLIAWIFGLGLEIAGYVSRIQMHNNIFASNPFLIYLICLTIAPAFLTGGIYLCFSRIIVTYGEHLARFKPKTYTVIFVCSDIWALVLQAAGGALTDISDSGSSMQQIGIDIMIGGLGCQVFSLTVFIILCVDYAWRVNKAGASSRPALAEFHCSHVHFHLFLLAIVTAVITIYIRSCFRVAELSQGFGGKLANDQVTFMLLEGAMVSLAALALTVMHPGPVFKDAWKLGIARDRMTNLKSGTFNYEMLNSKAAPGSRGTAMAYSNA